MDSEQKTRVKASPFTILLLLLFSLILFQLYLFGFGVIKQLKADPVVKIVEKEVTKIVAPPSSTPPVVAVDPLETVTHRITSQNFTSDRVVKKIETDQKFTFDPKVKNVKVRDFLVEAKRARSVGDLRLMALNLEEALKESPKSPHANFLFGDMYEAMGLYDKAAAFYETVISLGVESAGSLYKSATQKLKQGLELETNASHELTIGNVNSFHDPSIHTGKSIQLTIPILSNPRNIIDPSQVTLSVRIYDKKDSEVIPCLPENKAVCQWLDEKVDWLDNGVETLKAEYFLPKSDAKTTDPTQVREYYGFIIELTYGGRLIDQYSYPRILFSEINQNIGFDVEAFDLESSGMNPNYSNLLLPPLE